ncbi:MAG: DMT family transporter [Vulcanimicrobiaceae bacterium]
MDNGKRLGATEWLLLAILSVLWGGSFFFFKVLVNAHLPPFTIVLGRVAIAALALLAFVHFTGRRMPRSPSVWLAFLVMGALNNAIPFSLIVFGETRLDSGLAAIFNATTPMFTILLAHAFTSDERLTPNKVLGIALGLLGVIVLTGLQAVHGVNLASIAQVACLGAAFAYGCAGIYGRRFRAMGVDPIIAATGQLCGSTLLVTPLAVLVDRPWALAYSTAGALLAWLGLAVLSTAVAYVIYFRILATAGATNLLLVTLLIPVSASFLGVSMLGERFGAANAAGFALIALGLGAVDGRIVALLRRHAAA